jgi:hypothetical protein
VAPVLHSRTGVMVMSGNRPRALLVSLVGAAAVLGAVGVAGAEPAPEPNPAQQQFISDVTGLGTVAGITNDAVILSTGGLVCDALSKGNTRLSVAKWYRGYSRDMAIADSTVFVDFAIKDLCPEAPPKPGPRDQAGAEQVVRAAYLTMQKGCRPDLDPQFQSITWDAPGFSPEAGGSGVINDAVRGLGGQFQTAWTIDGWDTEFLFC